MKVAVFGGAFNPPHVGHQLTIARLLNSKLVDEVWLVPSGDRVDKKSEISTKHRIALVKRLQTSCNDKRVKVDTVQIDEKLPGSYTIDLLRHYKKKHPRDTFYFVVGSDLEKDIKKWKEGAALLREFKFIVIYRPTNVSNSIKLPKSFVIVPDPLNLTSTVSSSACRKVLSTGSLAAGMMPKEVLAYIKRYSLYNG